MGYFQSSEFLCKCGRAACDAPKEPARLLVDLLSTLRQRLGRPVIITSGMRCRYWNAHEGGTPNSGHLSAEEADIACATSAERWDIFRALYLTGVPLFTRIGVGKTFIHLGVSSRLLQNVVWTYYPKES